MIQLNSHAMSDRGQVREANKDASGAFFDDRLMIVASGDPDAQAGELVSREAVDLIREVVAQGESFVEGAGVGEDGPSRRIGAKGLECAVQHANTVLHSMRSALAGKETSGAAVCCILVEGRIAHVTNVGETRAFLLRDEELLTISGDPAVASDSTQRLVGESSYVEIATTERRLRMGDVLLLCTAGLFPIVDEDTIAELMTQDGESPAEIAENLVASANARGGPDNITALVARVHDPDMDRAICRSDRLEEMRRIIAKIDSKMGLGEMVIAETLLKKGINKLGNEPLLEAARLHLSLAKKHRQLGDIEQRMAKLRRQVEIAARALQPNADSDNNPEPVER